MSALFGLVVCMVILTMIGSQFLTKDQLSVLIDPTFFFGFVVIGFFIAQKALPNKYIHSTVLALILVAFMALFLDVVKQVPTNLWKFLGLSFVLMQVGIGLNLALKHFKK
ncbi:hypothetical protein SKM52_04570 [Acinetobacter faecalis]|uniref:hypothetical protein n=1 Tax=Acinetobacter faecalis TaxID=2665161 RepID=UPI002A90CC5A|nr:hypothetical protein [Acinetobacter faecalis]MDY6523822.1 hypothetical protein [Acinetobacter faecalis]MDY6536370.1 hypothetical protein [Acinetobacter faecalis]